MDGLTDDADVSEITSSSLDEIVKVSEIIAAGQNRYFILKSLTYNELASSVKSKRWSTQIHNEKNLNDAYKSSGQVFLIFSVNRSKEYFGYARMASPIESSSSPAAAETESPIESLETQVFDPQRAITTPAIGLIPEGFIVDELYRGRIYWEARPSNLAADEPIQTDGIETMMKSFALEWVSLRRLPFKYTTHIRNMWNGNKEVKVARDGTELETNAGRDLCSLFHNHNVTYGERSQ